MYAILCTDITVQQLALVFIYEEMNISVATETATKIDLNMYILGWKYK